MTSQVDEYLLPGLIVASIGALSIALIAQYGYGFEPCVLCSYQRIPYVAVVIFGAIGLHVEGCDRLGVATLLGVVFALGAALAFYHVGVEQHWWAAATSCGGGSGSYFQDFKNFIANPLKGLNKRCDEIDWTLFGLSMTVYNVAASLSLALVSFAGAYQANKDQGHG